MTHEEKRYGEGEELAQRWIAAGNTLLADAPGSDEAFDNGFCDRLAQEREALAGISD